MEHVLDSPAWHALNTHNKALSFGNDRARYFDRAVSPFAATEVVSEGHLHLLYDIVGHEGSILLMSPYKVEVPDFWKQLALIKGIQMVWDATTKLEDPRLEITPLNDTHVPQMLSLTKLTNPGPFHSRTIDFGHYAGVFEGDQLAAMAGQRLHLPGYAEISAVCTHPDHTCKGYGRQLLLHQLHRIVNAGEVPFLHVRDDNERAINLYGSLGFAKRTGMYFYLLGKQPAI